MNKIEIFYQDIKPINITKPHITKNIKYLVKNENRKLGIVSLIFCSDNYLLDINKNYLNHNYYTDIITFNYVEDKVISGDLFISIDRVKENAIEFDTIFENELYRVIFHGILHLIGYNDKTREEKRVMREKEDLYLSAVDFKEIEI